MDVSTAHIALHRSAHSRGYKLLREEADLKSLLWCVSLSACSASCVSMGGGLDVAPASPFIVPNGRARVTIVVEGENMKENVALGMTVLLLIWREQFTI
jgi:hypothetical protein